MILCVKCSKAYVTKKQEVVVNELAHFGSYKLWEADLKECPVCHNQIISGFAQMNSSEHYQIGYKEKLEKAKEKGILYDWRNRRLWKIS